MRVNINFERRDLTFVQKSHTSPEHFGEAFAFNLIKQNVTYFSFIFLTKLTTASYFKFLHVVSMVAYQSKVLRVDINKNV